MANLVTYICIYHSYKSFKKICVVIYVSVIFVVLLYACDIQRITTQLHCSC